MTKIHTFYEKDFLFTPYSHGGTYNVNLTDFITDILSLGISMRFEKHGDEIFVIFYE